MKFKIVRFFDKLEDKIRGSLSHKPIIYALIGAAAIVLFWRGVWLTADMFDFMTGPVSIIVSVIVLLLTGLFVSFFIGEQIIISGLKGEKKIAEKTEEEIKTEADLLVNIDSQLKEMKKDISQIKKKIK